MKKTRCRVKEEKEEKKKKTKKSLGKDQEHFSIKQGLGGFLRLKTLVPHIEKLVISVSIWAHRASVLHNMHFTRMIENGNSITSWSQTDVDHAFAMVSNTYAEDDSELWVTYSKHFIPIFGDSIKTPMERKHAAVQACCLARIDYLTAASNNILTNFYPRLCR